MISLLTNAKAKIAQMSSTVHKKVDEEFVEGDDDDVKVVEREPKRARLMDAGNTMVLDDD